MYPIHCINVLSKNIEISKLFQRNFYFFTAEKISVFCMGKFYNVKDNIFFQSHSPSKK